VPPTPAVAAPRPHSRRLPRWLGVIVPLSLLTALSLAYTAAVNRTLHPAVVQAAGAAALGMVAGALTRRYAAGRPLFTQWWISLAAATLGLLLGGLVSGGASGIAAPLLASPAPRIAELAWLSIAGLGAWLALRYRRPRSVRTPRAGLRQRVQATRQDLRDWWQRASPASRWRRHRLGERPTQPRLAAATAAAAPRRSSRGVTTPGTRSAKGASTKTSRPRTTRTAGRATRRAARRAIRFTGSEEARCPYCLEPVRPNDPRGSKVCPVCHTRHHADCWAVTGVCQMPHLYVDATAGRQGANQ
jgi:hypothetical protein